MRHSALAVALLVTSWLLSTVAWATPFPVGGFLRAAFATSPIPADGQATSLLNIDLIDPSGGVASVEPVTLSLSIADPAFCNFGDAIAAQPILVGGHAQIWVSSTSEPGTCHVVVTAPGLGSADALLVTRLAGTATRLTVSGNDSPRPVDQVVSIAVDVDDVYVNLVADDQSTVVTPMLDPLSCAGAPGGDVVIAGTTGGIAVNGRTWFTARSLGSYRACRIMFFASGLRTAGATIAFVAGPPDHLSCAFDPGAIRSGEIAAAAVELRDLWGNRAVTSLSYAVSLTPLGGDHTSLASEAERAVTQGAAFFFVRGVTPGDDDYVAALSSTSSGTLASPATACRVIVQGPDLTSGR